MPQPARRIFFLIVSSFAFSIILFLAFSATIDFMHHAITPLRPYTPDISIISTDNTCAIPKQLAEQISQEPAVKQAYGRSFAYRLPVQIAGTARTVNLISYEDQQLQWAEAELLNGSLLEISQGKSLLLVYDDENPAHARRYRDLSNRRWSPANTNWRHDFYLPVSTGTRRRNNDLFGSTLLPS